MASSRIRKAIGGVKDHTSISIAKVASNFDPKLDILIVKATSHDDSIPNEKYYHEILRRSLVSKELVSECVGLVSKRVERTCDWIVALKSLILFHRLMVDGGKVFMQVIASSGKGGGMLSNMCAFKDETHLDPWDYTEFVRGCGMYLDEKVELMVFDEMWFRKRVKFFDGLDRLEEKERKMEVARLSDEMAIKRVLRRVEQLQRLLQRVLSIRPWSVSKHRKLFALALCPVVEESFNLYGEIYEGLSFLLDKFWGMKYWTCVNTLGTYVTVGNQIDELVDFYASCKDFGVATPSEYPVIQRIDDDLLSSMENHMKRKAYDRKRAAKNKPGNSLLSNEEQQNQSRGTIGLKPISENFSDEFEPLLDLNDDRTPAAVQVDQLALALFCDDEASLANSPWENISDTAELQMSAPGWQTLDADPSIADWEVALVESASNLMKQKVEPDGKFNAFLPDGMYHHKTLSENIS